MVNIKNFDEYLIIKKIFFYNNKFLNNYGTCILVFCGIYIAINN